MEDDAIRGLTVIKDGAITWPPPPLKLPAPPAAKPAAMPPKAPKHGEASAPASGTSTAITFLVAAALFWFIGAYAPPAFLGHFTVFVLACLRRLHGGVERDAGAAYAADERDQCDQQHHRHRRAGAGRPADHGQPATGRRRGSSGWRWPASR